MQSRIILCLTIVLTFLLAACTAAPENTAKQVASVSAASPAENVEQVITKLEQEWLAAILKNDVAVYDRIEAEDWIFITADGRMMSKAQDLAEAKAKAYQVTTASISDVKVRVYGETAVATLTQDEKKYV